MSTHDGHEQRADDDWKSRMLEEAWTALERFLRAPGLPAPQIAVPRCSCAASRTVESVPVNREQAA